MNILLINHYAGSLLHGMEYRPYYLAREWLRMGHEVLIVAASESHVRSDKPQMHGPLTEENIDGLVYNWVKTPSYQGNGLKRGLNILAFIVQLFRFSQKWVQAFKPDLVISSSTYPLDICPGRWIARQAGAKLVYEVHDLFLLSLTEVGGMPSFHPFVRLMKWAEHYAFRNADHIISLLPAALPYMKTHGMAPVKFHYVPNGIDSMEWDAQHALLPMEHHLFFKNIRKKNNLLIGYAGAHGQANALDSILDAAHLVKNIPVNFVLIGQGPEKPRLLQRCAQEGLMNVSFLPLVTKEAIPSLLRELDILYIGLKNEPLFEFGVSPNKLMDYMMAAKPIIFAIAAGNDPVQDAACGISIPPESPEALADAVQKFLNMSENDRKEMGLRGREYVKNHHDYRILAKEFLHAVS